MLNGSLITDELVHETIFRKIRWLQMKLRTFLQTKLLISPHPLFNELGENRLVKIVANLWETVTNL